ncbi:MAG: hypothetical protein M3281_01950, partial [Chloroflexota bacterium]|nr:hypothetical protein [Chloroflexota bacterium]
LLAFSVEPQLGAHVCADSEHLLFRREDFERPGASPVFDALARLPHPAVSALAPRLQAFLRGDMSTIPPLSSLAVSPAGVGTSQLGSRPHWLEDHLPKPTPSTGTPAPVPAASSGGVPTWVTEHLETAQAIRLPVSPLPERLACALWAAVSAVLTGSALNGLLAPEIAVLVSVCALAVVLSALVARYLSRPEVSEKLAALALVRTAESTTSREERALGRLEQRRSQLQRRVDRQLATVQARRSECDGRERVSLARINDELRPAIEALDAREQASWGAQRQDIERATRQYHNAFIAHELSRALLLTARIPRLGLPLKYRLITLGVLTAGDIADVYIPRGHQHQPQVVLEGGRRVAVDGMGRTKAQALLDWRHSVEVEARARQPRGLPPGQVSCISAPYRRQREWLAQRRHRLERRAEARRDAVRRRYGSERHRLARQEITLRDHLASEDRAYQQQLADTRQRLSRAQGQLTAARQQLDPYSDITFRAYLRQVVRFPLSP